MQSSQLFKNHLFLILLFYCKCLLAQKEIIPADTVRITGKVEKELIFSVNDLAAMNAKPIGDLIITNHKGEAKGTLTNLKGVLLKEVLASLIIKADQPKQLSEFYFKCTAADGYKVIFSWNEIYNTDTGKGIYIVTSINDRLLKELPQRILLISNKDMVTGRRYVKGLKEIEVVYAD